MEAAPQPLVRTYGAGGQVIWSSETLVHRQCKMTVKGNYRKLFRLRKTGISSRTGCGTTPEITTRKKQVESRLRIKLIASWHGLGLFW